eukprot:4124845-Prymnesium_polylepis.1
MRVHTSLYKSLQVYTGRAGNDELPRFGRGARHHSGRHGATAAVDASVLVPACVTPPTTRCPSDVIAAGAAA